MDRDFIARNQIVERYLSGRLPLKGATDFERFCKDNPKVLDELGLPERVNAGLRLLEASGKPEPWQEKSQRFWTKPQFVLGLMGAVLLLGVGLAVVASDNSTKEPEDCQAREAGRRAASGSGDEHAGDSAGSEPRSRIQYACRRDRRRTRAAGRLQDRRDALGL